MKILNWVRPVLLISSLILVFVGYTTFDPYQSGICSGGDSCFFSDWRKNISEPLFLSSLFFSIVLFFTFFISNKIFKKWLVLAAVWLAVDIVWIVNAPVYSHYYFDIGPTTKELVSVWMGSFFVIVSLGMFVTMKIRKSKRYNNQDTNIK